MLTVDPHPLLDLALVDVDLAVALADLPSPAWLVDLLRPGANAPLAPPPDLRAAVRDLLRHGGFRPTGRSKPSSEYLERAAAEQRLASINALVDAGNAVSLHSGLPISVVDLDRAAPPLRVALGEPGARYPFNQSGQEIDVAGLLCLCDRVGACANAVKDAQRTKTGPETRRALFLVWGTRADVRRTEDAAGWLHDVLTRCGVAPAGPAFPCRV